MDFKNIEIQIPMSELTDLQKLHLETANQLISNMFSVSPVKIPKNKFSYDGETFTLNSFGSFHNILLNDINTVIQNNESEHRELILKNVTEFFKDYPKFKFEKIKDDNLKETFTILFNYYKLSFTLNYPKYLGTQKHKQFIEKLEKEVISQFVLD